MEEQTFARWVELPDAQPVRFDDLPALIAGALHEAEFAQAAAEINLEAELRAMVAAGEVQVRNALTLGPHTFPFGQALRDSVLLPEDLRPLLTKRGIGIRFKAAIAHPPPGALIEGHRKGGAMTKPLHEWTDAEIEETRQTALRAARVHRVLDEAARTSRALDALFASDEPPRRRAEPAPSTAAPAPTAASAPAVAPKTHKTKRRAEPLAAVLTEAKRNALDSTDWQSVWAALVKLAESASRPAPLLGYVEGEGVQYRTDDAEQPVGYLKRDALRKRFERKG